MTEPRDEIDSWLSQEVQPLPPRPGTFELVRRRARRRKRNQAMLATAGAVVVIAGAVLAPTLGPGLLSGHGHGHSQPLAASGSASHSPVTPRKSVSSSPSSSPPFSPAASSSGVAPAGTSGLSSSSSGIAPPAGFRPTSITMIGTGVGAVIGQAGTPGHCSGPVPADCTSLAGTSTYGKSWYGITAPVTSAPKGPLGVSQLRFLNLNDGWAFGPALQETSDGGRNWTRVPTFGLRVTSLEAAGSRAFVVLASCQGDSADYAADCSAFSLYALAAGSQVLQRVGLPAGLGADALGTPGRASSASLVIRGDPANVQDGTAYLLAPSGQLLSGSVGGGSWRLAGKAPCAPGTAAASGAPLGAQLTVGDGTLLLDCAGRGTGSTQPKQLWTSADGAHWAKLSQPPTAGTATSLAATSSGQVILATTAGIDYSPADSSWQSAAVIGGAPAGGFSYVGMTSATQGVALPADPRLGEVFVTEDSGKTWSAFRISSG